MTVQAWEESCVTHIKREKRSRIMVSYPFNEFLCYFDRFIDELLFSVERTRRTRLNVNYRSLPAGFSIMDGTASGIELKDIRQILQVLYGTRFRANTQSALSPSQILSSVIGRFFNLPLLSYHCLCNPALVVPRSRARIRYRSFGNWFFRAIREALGMNANSYPSLYSSMN